MTPEQTARIVKVCERIGWPKMSLMPNDNYSWELVLSCDDETIDYEIEYALESHFRQWLKSKYDRVLIEYTTGLPFKWRIECGLDREMESRVRLAGNDYLDLLLTAVERTLE